MARMVVKGFPLPLGEGGLWCAGCVALVKGLVLMPQQELIEAGLADSKSETFTVQGNAVEISKHLQPAVTWAPVAVLGGVMAPVCWNHAPAVDGMAAAPDDVTGAEHSHGLYVPGHGWSGRRDG